MNIINLEKVSNMMKKLVSLFVASIMLVSMVQTALGEEQPEIVGLGYTEEEKANMLLTGFDVDEYVVGLLATGAEIVDGNIVNVTVETVDYMAKSMKNYWEKHLGKFKGVDLRIYRTALVGYILGSLSETVVNELLDSYKVCNPLPYGNESRGEERFDGVYTFLLSRVLEYFGDVVGGEFNNEAYLFVSPFILDDKIRECMKKIEEYDMYYLSVESYSDYKTTYYDRQNDLINFIYHKKNNFPFQLADLQKWAEYPIFRKMSNSALLYMGTSKASVRMDLNRLTDDEFKNRAKEAISEVVEQYSNSHQR